MTFHPTALMNFRVILTFALDNKPRMLSRTEESACTASWGLDLLSLHFIATVRKTQGTAVDLTVCGFESSSHLLRTCNSQRQKFHSPKSSSHFLSLVALGSQTQACACWVGTPYHWVTPQLAFILLYRRTLLRRILKKMCAFRWVTLCWDPPHICTHTYICMHSHACTSELGTQIKPY